MIRNSARFTAGHFFQQMVLLSAVLLLSCTGNKGAESPEPALPGSACETPVLIMVTSPGEFMPESVREIENTAFGRFFPSDEQPGNPFLQTAAEADSSGMLILAVLQVGMEWTGTREHLVIWLDSLGRPAHVQPEMDSNLLADSLWEDPLIRQNTIAELTEFTRPDIVLEHLAGSGRLVEIAAFWSSAGTERNMTACLYSMPDTETAFRGWGLFTGCSVSGTSIRGMTLNDFHATFLLLAGLEWIETGYPVVVAFPQMESE